MTRSSLDSHLTVTERSLADIADTLRELLAVYRAREDGHVEDRIVERLHDALVKALAVKEPQP